MSTYYVDVTDGSDSNNGTSVLTPWKTLDKITSSSLSAADVINLKRGEVWRDAYVISDGGSAGNLITLGTYGTGDKPKITGFDLVESWTLHTGSVYKKTISPEPEGDEIQSVLESDTGTWYALQSSAVNVDGSGEYFYDSSTNILYVQTSDDAAPSTHTVEAAVRRYCISMCGNPYSDCGHGYLRFENLHITGANEYGLFFNNDSHYEVDGLTIEYCGEMGIYHRNNPAGTVDDLSVTNTIIRYIGTDPTGESLVICGIRTEGVNDAVITDNTIQTVYGPGVIVTAQTGEVDVTGASVQMNRITNCRNSIYMFRATAPAVLRNTVSDGYDIGIFIGQDSDGATVHYNLISNLVQIVGHGGFNGIDINNAEDGFAYNNTIINVTGGCIIIDKTAKGDGWTFKNNILHAEDNPKPTGGGNAYTMYIDADVLTITSDYNWHYFPTGNDAGEAISWIGTPYDPDEWALFVSTESQEANGTGFSTDPEADGYMLQPTSPCIDTGVDVSLTRDIIGNVVGATPDVGAYEFIALIGSGIGMEIGIGF